MRYASSSRAGVFLTGFAVIAATSVGATAAAATEPLPARAQSDDELATVRVRLPPGGARPTVEVLRRHRSGTSKLSADASWFGVCLADRRQLEAWRKQHPRRRAERRLWDRALRSRGYEAFVHLSPSLRDGLLRPACYGVADGMSMRHTDVHPDYRAYVQRAFAGTLPKPAYVPNGPPLLD